MNREYLIDCLCPSLADCKGRNCDSCNAKLNGYLDEYETETRKDERTKVVECIRSHLCVKDEDYDKPILSPKYLDDYLDMMRLDGFHDQ